MLVPDHKSTRGCTRRRLGRGTAVTVLSLAVGLGVVSPVAASAADRTTTARPATDRVARSEAAVAVPSSEGTVIGSAQTARTPFAPTIRAARADLTTAQTYLKNHQYTKANTALRTLRVKLANVDRARNGPARVIWVLNLEHRVAMSLLPPFNGLTSSSVINALQTTLSTTFANRTARLKAVVALPQEGAGGDYDDGMADTLTLYSAEVSAYTAARSQFRLTAQASTALTKDLAQVRATSLQVTTRFGGGE